MKSKRKWMFFVLAAVCMAGVTGAIALFCFSASSNNKYAFDDIPRRYVIGEITSISEQDGDIELLLENGEPASVTMTVTGEVEVYEIVSEHVRTVDFSKLQIGQTVQCDVRLAVTLEKTNSFHDCRQIFVLPGE